MRMSACHSLWSQCSGYQSPGIWGEGTERNSTRVVLSQILELCNRFGHVWDSAQGCYDGAMQRRSVSDHRWAVKLENEWSRDVAIVCISRNALIS